METIDLKPGLKPIDQIQQPVNRPERILQYGEGNFLRGFADWQVDILNEKTNFNGNVVAVQPRNRKGAQGALINAQRGLYTTVLRGLEGEKRTEEFRVVRSLSRCVNPYTQFDEYIACAENPELRFVFSNTTEAGISYGEGEEPHDRPQLSFPGKVAAFLQETMFRRCKDPRRRTGLPGNRHIQKRNYPVTTRTRRAVDSTGTRPAVPHPFRSPFHYRLHRWR